MISTVYFHYWKQARRVGLGEGVGVTNTPGLLWFIHIEIPNTGRTFFWVILLLRKEDTICVDLVVKRFFSFFFWSYYFEHGVFWLKMIFFLIFLIISCNLSQLYITARGVILRVAGAWNVKRVTANGILVLFFAISYNLKTRILSVLSFSNWTNPTIQKKPRNRRNSCSFCF